MRVKLTLERPGGHTVDVAVTADATATVEDVARAIATTDPASNWRDMARGAVTLAVAPPTAERLVPLAANLLLAEAPLGSGFRAAVVPAHTASSGGAHAAVIRVTAGPDSGREFRVGRGHSTIGRDASADIVLSDPLVSKRHARLEASSTTELIDLNSANGIIVDGALVPRVRLTPNQRVLLGDTELIVTRIGGPEGEESGDEVLERGGGLLFNRSPRVEVRYPGTDYPSPQVPSESQPRLFPWPMLIAPVLMGVAIFSITGRALSLLIVFATPLMLVANMVGQRNTAGQKLRNEVEMFETQLEELQEELTRQAVVERERRDAEMPAVAHIYEDAMRLGPMLWTRRPEHWNFLGVRLGVNRALSRNTIDSRDNARGIVKYQRQVDKLQKMFEYVDDVPLVELLPSSGAIGVAGPHQAVADAARGLGVQLFGMHAPNEVVAAAIVGPAWSAELEWMKWLPHTSSPRSPFADAPLADTAGAGTVLLNALEEAILERENVPRGPLRTAESSMTLGSQVGETSVTVGLTDGDIALVLFISHDAPVDRRRLTQLVERGADAGVYAVFLAPTVESLPAACRTFVDVSAGLDAARVGYVRSGESYDGVRVEGVSNPYANVFATRLAPVVDASTVEADASDIPRTVSLLSLLGTELAETSQAVIERWRQNTSIIDRSGAQLPRLKRAGTLKAFVGQGSPDAMTLDLRTQGPHALVGGTTGAGKSEFLQSWVLGMAAEYSPDRVTFLFVDYKGGSAFADAVELPHTVGLVTDLSPHLVRRALTSLRAELHHREHLFNRKKAKDLLELEKRRDPETPPALVLVIDEFAALANEMPEFVDGVVDIAQRGRSLGIHLIMATQRPAGVIKDNLRANTNMRVALRMADESDSKDVVGDPVAGTFDPSIPGRAIAKTGPGRLVPFQSAYAGGWTSDAPAAAEVRIAELRFGSLLLWEAEQDPADESHETNEGPNDLRRLVGALVRAAEDARIPAPRKPWLDELPHAVELRELSGSGDARIPLGLADVPERQLQEAVHFVPDRDGSMLVYGTSGSGKSTVLRSVAIAAGLRPDLGGVEVYGLDFGSGALRSLEGLPHVGSVISGDDSERVQRLLASIGRALDDRTQRFSAVDASSLTEYRRISGTDEPRIILVLDGFGAFKSEWETTSTRTQFYNLFMRILGEGRPLGVHAVISADRSGSVPTAVSANITRRIVLRQADQGAYSVLGVPKDVLDDSSAPGRAIVDGLEAQIGVLGATSNTAEQARELEVLADELRLRGAVEVPEIGALPRVLDPGDLPAEVDGAPTLGIAEDTLAPRGFEPVGAFVVTGPPRSGKTTAMRHLIDTVRRAHPDVRLFHIAGRRAQLGDHVEWMRSATKVEEVVELAKELTAVVSDESMPAKLMIVVEQVPQFSDSDAERPLKALFQAVNRSEHFLVGDADVSQLTSGFGFVSDFKAGRQGVALRPDSSDGDSLFKVPFGRVKRADYPEGRGIFVQEGRQATVQLPLVPARRESGTADRTAPAMGTAAAADGD